jgi:hypothetical protein
VYDGWEEAELINTPEFSKLYDWRIYDMYLLTEIGLTPGGSSTHKKYTERQKQQQQQYVQQHKNVWNSAGRAPSWRVIPWHLPYI